MSGAKTFTIASGIAPVLPVAGIAPILPIAGLAIGATIALQAYHQRRQRQQKAALEKEAAIQQQIANLQAQNAEKRVVVKLPKSMPMGANDVLTKDMQRQIGALKSQLPQIESQYRGLVEQQLIDRETLEDALKLVSQALNANELLLAEGHLQSLDDARIQFMQVLQAERTAQIQYLQGRLSELRSRLPENVIQDISTRIDYFSSNWQQFTDTQLQENHSYLNDLEAQAEQIQEAADNLVNSWLEVGYQAHILGIDNGDIAIEVDTHEGAKTRICVQFFGQQIDLSGPSEESESCVHRTFEALRIFQEQGYPLEWNSWDGQAVPEEWRYIYASPIQTQPTPQRLAVQEHET
jgi:hypothetical protein